MLTSRGLYVAREADPSVRILVHRLLVTVRGQGPMF